MLSFSIWIISLAPFTSAALHSLQYFYTATSGISGFPEFTSVGKVDGLEISNYDSTSKKAFSKQGWMNWTGLDDPKYWLTETEVAMDYEKTFKADMGILKERFHQTGGVHTFQKMYGCQWDDETQAIDGFEQFGYDGEDFMTLDLKNMMWIAAVYQASPTRNKWNRDELAFPNRRNYFHKDCVEWLQKYLHHGNSALRRTVRPKVSLLQKGSNVACHATGFYPEAVMITWKRDGVKVEDDVDVGETLPNDDETFQKRVVLTVSPKERKKAQYSCVTHWSGEPIVLFHEEANLNLNLIRVIVVGVIIGILVSVLVILAKRFIRKKKELTPPSSGSSTPLFIMDHPFKRKTHCSSTDMEYNITLNKLTR